ncbi:MAG: M23 family metallopeptidase [Taibaiella sp.]|nr:M23 family metallopeptidase [Taibaiella sp.]
MIVYSLLSVTLAFAALSIWLLLQYGNKYSNRSALYPILPLSMAVFIYLFGTWVFLSIFLKQLFAIVFLVTLMRTVVKKQNKKLSAPLRILPIIFILLFSLMSVLYFTGTAGTPFGIIDLAMPFKKGTYFVFQGGKGLPTNLFHYTGRRTPYAMDIIKLNKYGNRADAIFSTQLADYEIFGDTIYSSCSGTILTTETDNPDNIPPNRKRGPTNLNRVLVETATAYVFMGHLKQGSVLVKAGDKVSVGQPIGLVGNSGMTLEPHLHIQVHAKTTADLPWYRQPQLLIQFNGKEYLLFEEIIADK